MKDYLTYFRVTKEALDFIKFGDLVKLNDWKKPMRVRGVSENYLVMTETSFGKTWYSVIEKKPRTDGNRNEMRQGYFHVGRDDLIFGDIDFRYQFYDGEAVKAYLQKFEEGINKLSVRNAIPIRRLSIKPSKNGVDADARTRNTKPDSPGDI